MVKQHLTGHCPGSNSQIERPSVESAAAAAAAADYLEALCGTSKQTINIAWVNLVVSLRVVRGGKGFTARHLAHLKAICERQQHGSQ